MHQHLHDRGPRGEEREKGPEKIHQGIIAEKFSNIGKETVPQVQEAQRVLSWLKPCRNMLSHILIDWKKIKDKEKILKITRGRICKIQTSDDCWAETLQAIKEWHNIFKVMKGKNLQLRVFYPVRILFIFDGEIKSFTYKQKISHYH